MARTRSLWLLGLLTAAAFLSAQESDQEPRLGGAKGRLRYRIVRGPAEEVEVPDVLTLKDGRKLEAYFLDVYGDWLVFYVKDDERSWLKEELPRTEVTSIDFDQYLPKDPLLPRSIGPSSKQPVPKDDFLAGAFDAAKGRNTRFKLTFTSEIDKLFNYTEDATDYGTVEVESRSASGSGDTARSHEVGGSGRYYLYAPGTINNSEWVLLLSEVVVREVDRGFDTTLFTNVVPDEAFICRFDPFKDSFRLEWSNLGSWTWSSLTGMTFRRVGDDRSLREEPVRSRPPARRQLFEREPTLVLASRTPATTEKKSASAQEAPTPSSYRWRIDEWKPPPRRWK